MVRTRPQSSSPHSHNTYLKEPSGRVSASLMDSLTALAATSFRATRSSRKLTLQAYSVSLWPGVEVPGDDHPPFLGDSDAIVDRIEAFTKESWREIEPDRVLATVLFTDIVGSTARAAELGDASWRELIERHHELVRSQLTRYRGREIDTAGDGFFATFDGPARAVRCARRRPPP